MPPNNPSPRKDSRGYAWIDIDDFSPGVYTSDVTSAPNYVYAHTAPMGSAQLPNTWGCLPVLGGGLGPGPSLQASIPPGYLSEWFNGSGGAGSSGTIGRIIISAFISNPGLKQKGEIVFVAEGLYAFNIGANTAQWLQALGSYSFANDSISDIESGQYNAINQLLWTAPNASAGLQNAPVGGMAISTRATGSNPTTTVGYPVFASSIPAPTNMTLALASPISNNIGLILLYPNPTNQNTYAYTPTQIYAATSAGTGTTLLITSTLGISPGMKVTGAGISTTITVVSVNPAGPSVTLSASITHTASNYTFTPWTGSATGALCVSAFGYGSGISQQISGLMTGYQGRVVSFDQEFWEAPTTNYSGTTAVGGSWIDNDRLSYTDPSNSFYLSGLYPNTPQEISLVPENPFGYGAAGSISAGELFCVKQHGGGLVLVGDMNNPNVTYLPGVQPTGSLPSTSNLNTAGSPGYPSGLYQRNSYFGVGESSTQGYYYCSGDQGAWVWNGGNTSSKISNQLNDNFFYDPSFPFSSLFFNCKKWGNYICFSNGWAYNEQLGSWWRMFDQGSGGSSTYFWYDTFSNSYQLWAANCVHDVTTTNTPPPANLADLWDRSVPTTTYSWQSQPIRLSENTQVDVREIVIRAINYPGQGANSTIDIYLANESEAPGAIGDYVGTITMNAGNDAGGLPATYRLPVGYKAQNLTITMQPSNTTQSNPTLSSQSPAPTIFSLSIAYREREKVATL